MAAADDLIAARDAAAAEIRLIREATLSGDWSNAPAGAKPNVEGGGANADHGEYYQRLLQTVRELTTQIDDLAAVSDGPFLRESKGIY